MSYLKRFATRVTPQSRPLAGQRANWAGGFAWSVDSWTQLHRFLVLGSEGGTYYASERKLTEKNARALGRCLAETGEVLLRNADHAMYHAKRRSAGDVLIYDPVLRARSEERRRLKHALKGVSERGELRLHFQPLVRLTSGWGGGRTAPPGKPNTTSTPSSRQSFKSRFKSRG